MADRINLTKTIVDRANNLFKMVHDGKNLKGRSNDAIAAACLYISCRQEGVPRTFKEIVAVSTVSKKEIGKIWFLLLLFFGGYILFFLKCFFFRFLFKFFPPIFLLACPLLIEE